MISYKSWLIRGNPVVAGVGLDRGDEILNPVAIVFLARRGGVQPMLGGLGWGVEKVGISGGWEGWKLRNCSAWKEWGTRPGGLGGACVQKPAYAWLPPSALEKHGN